MAYEDENMKRLRRFRQGPDVARQIDRHLDEPLFGIACRRLVDQLRLWHNGISSLANIRESILLSAPFSGCPSKRQIPRTAAPVPKRARSRADLRQWAVSELFSFQRSSILFNAAPGMMNRLRRKCPIKSPYPRMPRTSSHLSHRSRRLAILERRDAKKQACI